MKAHIWQTVVLTSALVSGQVHRHAQRLRRIPLSYHATTSPVQTFEQYIDHDNPDIGTFSQRWWYNADNWKGPGSPVVLFSPGEVAADDYVGYAYDGTISGAIAKDLGAAAIVLEHRYWGQSSPFPNLTTANLQYLTLDNNIRDLAHFALEAKLPWDDNTNSSSNAPEVPWILVGGSYPGVLAANAKAIMEDVFWAAYSSSAPVQVISNFWEYFAPIEAAAPPNCSTDVARVINHLDFVMKNGTTDNVKEVKTAFGLQDVVHNDDFMQALEEGPWLWQESESGFFEWCDYVEGAVNSTGPLPNEHGVGLDKALEGFARWMREVNLPKTCNNNPGCYNTHDPNASFYTDLSVNNPSNRQWTWMLCNEPFGFWQTGAPRHRPSLVSRLVTSDYWSRQCDYYFPPGPNNETYGLKKGKTEMDVNESTGGWNIIEARNLSRTIFTNGGRDPWLPGSVASPFRPGGPANETDSVVLHFIEEGTHCEDLLVTDGDAAVAKVQNASISQISEWVSQWEGRDH